MKRAYKLIVYRAKSGFAWRFVAPNGKIAATAHDVYSTASHARRSAESVLAAMRKPETVVIGA